MTLTDDALDLLAEKLAPLVARELAQLIDNKQSPAAMDQLLDVEGLAARLNVSVRKIRRLDATGKIPQAVRIGRSMRWRPEEITAWQLEGMPDRKRWEAISAAKKLRSTNFGGRR